jgi:hypothetical protein
MVSGTFMKLTHLAQIFLKYYYSIYTEITMQTFLAEVLDRTNVNNTNVNNFVKDDVFSMRPFFFFG